METITSNSGEQYELLEELGQGGMGIVFKARQPGLDRVVALKMLQPGLRPSPAAVERLRREAKAMARLDHPNIVKIFGLQTTNDGRPFLVIEYVAGKTLEQVIANQPLTADQCTIMFRQVLGALKSAHDAGLIHRDLKPSNIMLDDQLNVKLMDFGIVKALSEDSVPPQEASQSGKLLGSPAYMSPEQCRGEEVDSRSDIYSVGCVMFEALTSERLVEGDTPLEIMFKQIHEPASVQDRGLEPRFSQLIECALDKDPNGRFQSAADCLSALNEVASDKPLTFPAKPVKESKKDIDIRGVLAVVSIASISLLSIFFVAMKPAEHKSASVPAVDATDLALKAHHAKEEYVNDVTNRIFPEAELDRRRNEVIEVTKAALKANEHIMAPQILCDEYCTLADFIALSPTAFDEAETAIIKAEKVAPKDIRDGGVMYTCPMLSHANILSQYKKYDRADEIYRRVIDIRTNAAKTMPSLNYWVGEAYFCLARSYGQRDDAKRQEQALRTAAVFYSRSGRIRGLPEFVNEEMLAYILLGQGRVDEAREIATKVRAEIEDHLPSTREADQSSFEQLWMEVQAIIWIAAEAKGDVRTSNAAYDACFQRFHSSKELGTIRRLNSVTLDRERRIYQLGDRARALALLKASYDCELTYRNFSDEEKRQIQNDFETIRKTQGDQQKRQMEDLYIKLTAKA